MSSCRRGWNGNDPHISKVARLAAPPWLVAEVPSDSIETTRSEPGVITEDCLYSVASISDLPSRPSLLPVVFGTAVG